MHAAPAQLCKHLRTGKLLPAGNGTRVAPSDGMDFKRILVAVNSPTGPDAAFERALALARAGGAELYVLHAVPVNQRFSFRGGDRLERMADMRRRAEDAGVRVQTVEQHGDAAEIIELHASAREADLIVLGGEVRRGWRTRSSVVERVIRQTKVPTLVVPGDAGGASTVFSNTPPTSTPASPPFHSSPVSPSGYC